MKKTLFTLLGLMMVTSQLWAQSPIDGTWDFAMTSPMGSVNAKVLLVTDGTSLIGEFDLGAGRKWPIEEGLVNGNTISFKVTRDGAAMTYVMNATIDGDAAKGVATAMGSTAEWTMTRAN
jgi:hypothetical protein